MNTFRYIILWAAVAVAAIAGAEKAEELRLRIAAKPGVVSCNWEYKKQPQAIPNHGDLYEGTLSWYYDDADGIRRKASHVVQIFKLGDRDHEKAVWLGDPPSIDSQETHRVGTDEEIIAAIPTKIVKWQISRAEDSATVTGYHIVGADAVPVVYVVYDKDGALVAVAEKVKAEAVK